MDSAQQSTLPEYNDEIHQPHLHHELPAYGASTSAPAETTLTIDPTGLSITPLPLGSAPLYKFNASILGVTSFSSIKISKSNGDPTYSIAEQFISAQHPVPPKYRNVLVHRSTGLLAAVGLRKTLWEFSTQAPIPLKNGKIEDGGARVTEGGSTGSYLVTFGGDEIGVQEDILRFLDGKWTNNDGELLAISRDGGAEVEGMPVLSIVKVLEKEMTHFLVAAWCVVLWKEVGKRARNHKAQ